MDAFSAWLFLCLKANECRGTGSQGEGNGFICFFPSHFTLSLTQQQQEAASQDLQNLPHRKACHLVLSSFQMDKRCWICLARLIGLGLPFPEGDSGYETCSQSCPCLQALCSLVLLVSGLQSGLELGTEV